MKIADVFGSSFYGSDYDRDRDYDHDYRRRYRHHGHDDDRYYYRDCDRYRRYY